jgi:two-component system chemotaxis sensor kinase CheA
MIDQYRHAFREEAGELLCELEIGLLELDGNPSDHGLVDRVFRAMHTIKGSSAMFGFDDIATFTHEVETVLDLVRDGRLRVTKELIRLTLMARDRIKAMLHEPAELSSPDTVSAETLVSAFRELMIEQTGSVPDSPAVTTDTGTEATFLVRFRPEREIYRRGLNPDQILNELRELGSCQVTLHTTDIPPLDDIDPELCYLGWDVVLTTNRGIAAIHEVFMFLGEGSFVEIVPVSPCSPADRGDAADSVAVAPLEEVQQLPAADGRAERAKAISSIRVTAEKLDHLINLVGELVTAQARLSQMAVTRNDADLTGLAEEIERLTGGLRDTALTVRMIPLGGTFSKFKRLVHDLSLELGKDVELVTVGAETELDKTVIEKLNDPFVHLIRNCIDHGIESPEIRRACGKPSRGTIHLEACHSGDSVLLTIRDDGAGIDRAAVRERAVAKGLITPGSELTDREIFNLIFAPGFSTSKALTSISGRGVGMDVVKRGVESLRGAISIASNVGEGTTVTVRIPLTLAIIESLLVQIGSDCFVIPLSQVEECVELTSMDVAMAHGRRLVTVRDRMVPYIPLRETFGIAGTKPEIEQIVIVDLGEGKRVGFVVDHVIGGHQSVIKSIGSTYRDVCGVSGATILGDGTVALILDVQQLVDEEELSERSKTASETSFMEKGMTYV